MEGCRRCEYPRPDLHVWRASGVTKLVRALLNRRPSGRRNACQGARGSSRTGPTGAREGRNGTKRSRGTRTAGSRRGSAARGRRACQAGGSGSACGQGSPCKGPRGCQQWCQGCERNSSDCHGGSWSEGSAKNWYVTILLFFLRSKAYRNQCLRLRLAFLARGQLVQLAALVVAGEGLGRVLLLQAGAQVYRGVFQGEVRRYSYS